MSIPVNKRLYHLNGLSTDTKPIPSDISTGSTFLETDTGTTYVFSRATGTWKPLEDETSGKAIDAVCIGIVSIDKIKTEGLVDTYAIKYTNGASTTFTVTNGTFIEPNTTQEEETLIPNKLYTLDIDTNTYNIHDLFNIDSEVLDDGSLESAVIDHTKYWPRLTDGKFVLNVSEKSFSTVFEFVNTNEQGQDIWQAFVLDEENSFVRYVGHFEYVDDHNRDSSDYYFVAKPQTIKEVDTLEADLADTKALLEETRAELVVESQRAITKEDELQEAVDNLEFDKDKLFTDLNQEVSRAVIVEQTIKADLERDLDEEVQRATTRENELDALKAERTNPEQVILAGKFIVDNDENDDDRLTVNVEQGDNSVETNIDVNTLEANVRIRRNLTTEIGNRELSNANVDTIINGSKTTLVESVVKAENEDEEDTRLSVSETIENGNITEALTGTKSTYAGAIETSSETLEVSTLNNISANTSNLEISTHELNIEANGFGSIYTATRAEELPQESPEVEAGEINSLNIEAEDNLNIVAGTADVETGDCNINLNNETNINARNVTKQIRAINTTVDRTAEYKAGLQPSQTGEINYAVTFEADNQGAQLTVDGTYTETIDVKEIAIQGNETKTVEGNATEQIYGYLNQHVEGPALVNYETKAQIAFGKEVRQAEDVEEPYYSDAYILFNTNNEEQPEDRQTSLEIVSKQDLTLAANKVVINTPNQEINGNIDLNGDADIDGDLNVSSDVTLGTAGNNNTVTINATTIQNGNVTVNGNTTSNGNIEQHGSITIDGGVSNTRSANTLSTTIDSKAAITNEGNITNTGNIENTGNIANQGNLTNNGNVEINNGTLEVEGKTTLENDLEVQQNTALQGTLDVTGATELNDTLDVAEKATFDKTVEIIGATTSNGITNTGAIDNTGNITNSGILENTGKVTLKDDLNVKKNTVLEGTLEVQGGTTTTGITNTGNITNTGAITNTGNINNTGDISTTGAVSATTASISGNETVSGKVTTGTLESTGNASLKADVTVDGVFTATGKIVANANSVNITKPTNITGNTSITGSTNITGPTNITGNATISGTVTATDVVVGSDYYNTTFSQDGINALIKVKSGGYGTPAELTIPHSTGTIALVSQVEAAETAVKNYTDTEVDKLDIKIENLKSVQNVVEVVANKDALDRLDKTRYDDNDKVQVIDDEAHEHATTVYRLNNNIWEYINSYGGDSYTKTQANDRFVQKTVEVNGHALSADITLNKTDVGLSNVDNTSDINKPISNDTQAALNTKVDKTTTVNGYALSSNVTLGKIDIGLGNVDNTSDANKPISIATQSALDDKADKLTTYTKDDIDDKLENIPLTLSYENAELYEVFNDGRTQTVVTVDTLSADLAAANTLSISGAHGSITAAQYSKLNKETIVIWEAPDNSGNVALHYSSLVNRNEPCYQGFYGLPFTDGMVTVLVTFKDDLTWEAIYDGAAAETTANRVSAFQNIPDNTHYPTEKLVKDSLDDLETYVDTSIETASEITDTDYNDIENAFKAALIEE